LYCILKIAHHLYCVLKKAPKSRPKKVGKKDNKKGGKKDNKKGSKKGGKRWEKTLFLNLSCCCLEIGLKLCLSF